MDWIPQLLTARRPARWVLAAIVIVAGLCIFLPESARRALMIHDFVTEYGLFVGIVFLVALALLAVDGVLSLHGSIRGKRARAQREHRARERLRILDREEKAILREFLVQGRNTIQVPVDYPAVAGLLDAGVLVHVGLGTTGTRTVAGRLFPVARADFLLFEISTDHLDLPATEPTAMERAWVHNNRPGFATRLAEYDGLRFGSHPL